ncbi:MAG: MoaD/ThiS family protein [Pseudomonadota bacterium]
MSASPRLLYFGRLTDVTGSLEEATPVPLDVSNTTDLRNWADRLHGSTGAMTDQTVRIAIDGEVAIEPVSIEGATEIAFMPPVGGG